MVAYDLGHFRFRGIGPGRAGQLDRVVVVVICIDVGGLADLADALTEFVDSLAQRTAELVQPLGVEHDHVDHQHDRDFLWSYDGNHRAIVPVGAWRSRRSRF